MPNQAIVIGAGFAGLSSACYLAKYGYDVTILEKNKATGGRASVLQKDGFTFDMGPSWYWMPDVFEQFFSDFGKSVADYYELIRLDPGYQVIFGKDDVLTIPANLDETYALFESIEPGSGPKLKKFLDHAAYKYRVGIQKLVYKPGQSLGELLDPELIAGLFKLQVFKSISAEVRHYFKDPRLVQLLEFPVLFLGATAKEIPALYSLMNYADLALGTWYPKGGMMKIAEGMTALARELGVKIELGQPVDAINVRNGKAESVLANGQEWKADIVIGAGDYHHIEQQLLPAEYRRYSEQYWDKRTMAPSALLYYIGVEGKIDRLLHHSLFFDASMEAHADAIYHHPRWPERPLLYVSATSKTDDAVAPPGDENLVILIPMAPGLKDDNEEVREKYYQLAMERLEAFTGQSIRDRVKTVTSFAQSDFSQQFNSYKGNAYGLANTLFQTAHFKPKMKSSKVKNLYFAGQLTVPGPGVPPSLISGQVVANMARKNHRL